MKSTEPIKIAEQDEQLIDLKPEDHDNINSLILYGIELNLTKNLIESKIITPQLYSETLNLILLNLEINNIELIKSNFLAEESLQSWNFSENIDDELYNFIPQNIRTLFKKEDLYDYYKFWEKFYRSEGFGEICSLFLNFAVTSSDFNMTKLLFVDIFHYFLMFFNKKNGMIIEENEELPQEEINPDDFSGGVKTLVLGFLSIIGIFLLINLNITFAFNTNVNSLIKVNPSVKQTDLIPFGNKRFKNFALSGIDLFVDKENDVMKIVSNIIASKTDDRELYNTIDLIKNILEIGYSISHSDVLKDIKEKIILIQKNIINANIGGTSYLYRFGTFLFEKIGKPIKYGPIKLLRQLNNEKRLKALEELRLKELEETRQEALFNIHSSFGGKKSKKRKNNKSKKGKKRKNNKSKKGKKRKNNKSKINKN